MTCDDERGSRPQPRLARGRAWPDRELRGPQIGRAVVHAEGPLRHPAVRHMVAKWSSRWPGRWERPRSRLGKAHQVAPRRARNARTAACRAAGTPPGRRRAEHRRRQGPHHSPRSRRRTSCCTACSSAGPTRPARPRSACRPWTRPSHSPVLRERPAQEAHPAAVKTERVLSVLSGRGPGGVHPGVADPVRAPARGHERVGLQIPELQHSRRPGSAGRRPSAERGLSAMPLAGHTGSPPG